MNKYAKTAIKLFAAMPDSILPTIFQFNIFIFEARVSLQTLLQSTSVIEVKRQKVGPGKEYPKVFFFAFCRFMPFFKSPV